jgi:hypothetical protein
MLASTIMCAQIDQSAHSAKSFNIKLRIQIFCQFWRNKRVNPGEIFDEIYSIDRTNSVKLIPVLYIEA